jgi:hypothetical protein
VKAQTKRKMINQNKPKRTYHGLDLVQGDLLHEGNQFLLCFLRGEQVFPLSRGQRVVLFCDVHEEEQTTELYRTDKDVAQLHFSGCLGVDVDEAPSLYISAHASKDRQPFSLSFAPGARKDRGQRVLECGLHVV